jgi:hypothetical protein
MYADHKNWLPLDPAKIQEVYDAAAREHIMRTLRREHRLASAQCCKKSMRLDSSHPLPDPQNPSDGELLSSGFIVLLRTPRGKPTACALNPHLIVPQWVGALKRMYKKCAEELNALQTARDVFPFSSYTKWWKGFLKGVLKPKVDLLSSLDLDIPPQWRLPRPLSDEDFGLPEETTAANEDDHRRLKASREYMHGQTRFFTIDKQELKRRRRINDQAEDLLRERDALEIGMSILGI